MKTDRTDQVAHGHYAQKLAADQVEDCRTRFAAIPLNSQAWLVCRPRRLR